MRFFVLYIASFALLLSRGQPVWAQSTGKPSACDKHIHGIVLDGETQKPIADAVVFLDVENKSVTTSANGKFQIEDICADMVTLTCGFNGYKPLKLFINLLDNSQLKLTLHSETCELESVVIVADPKPVAIAPEHQLKGVELDRTRGLSLGQTLQNIPGVFALQTGPSIFKPIIQGVYGQRVLIMNNGVRQEGQQWGSEHAPEIDQFVASKITVVKGAQAVRYGSDAIGGVILVDAPNLRRTGGMDAEVNLVGFSNNRQGVASAIINYSVKKLPDLSFRIQGTLKQAGNTSTPRYWLANTGFTEKNYSWAMGYQKLRVGVTFFYSQFNNQLGIFTGSHFGDTADLAAAIRRPVPNTVSAFSYKIDRPYQLVTHELAKLKGYWRLSERTKLEADVARQYNYRAEFDTDRPYKNSLKSIPEMKFGLTTHTANLFLSGQFHPHLKVVTGLSGIRQANTARSTVGSFFIPNFLSYGMGIFAIATFRKNNWEAETGLRYDYKWMQSYLYKKIPGTIAEYELTQPTLAFQNPSANVGVGWQVNDYCKIKGNLSTAFRPPTANELYSNGVHHGINTFELGDSMLKSERAYSANVSVLLQMPKLVADISGYHNFIENFIFLKPANEYRVTIRGATPLFAYKQVDASFTGLDVSLTDSVVKHVTYATKLSLLRAQNVTTQEGLILTPPGRWANSITLHSSGNKSFQSPSLTIGHTRVFQKGNVPKKSDFKEPPAGYGLWNIDFGFESLVAKQKVGVTFSVNNLLNTTYRDYLDRFRYFNDAVGINFILRLKFVLGK